MNVIIVIVVLAALGLIGVVTKSIIAILLGTVGLAVSFLVFCTGALFSIIVKVIAIVVSIVVLLAIILTVPAVIFVIIPAICLGYWFARKKGYYRPAGEMCKRKAIA